MRTFPLLALLLVLPLTAPALARPTPGGVFTTADGVADVTLTFSTGCTGPTTLTLTIRPLPSGPTETRTVSATSIRTPDPCDFGCTGCEIPYTWTVVGYDGDVLLTGGGVAGPVGGWSLSGRFQEGVLEAYGAHASVDCGSLCTID